MSVETELHHYLNDQEAEEAEFSYWEEKAEVLLRTPDFINMALSEYLPEADLHFLEQHLAAKDYEMAGLSVAGIVKEYLKKKSTSVRDIKNLMHMCGVNPNQFEPE